MKLTFVSERIKRAKVGDYVPFGELIVKVEWDDTDILPNRQAFDAYMKEVIQPKLAPGKMKFSLEMRQADVSFATRSGAPADGTQPAAS